MAQVLPPWQQRRWPGSCPCMAPLMTHMLSLRHILLQTSSFSPNRNLFHCWDGSVYLSSSSRCFRISLHTFLKSRCPTRPESATVFPPGLNKMSSDAQSLEEIGRAAQAPLLNGKLAEEGKKTSRATDRHTQTHTAGCRERSSGNTSTYTHRRTS